LEHGHKRKICHKAAGDLHAVHLICPSPDPGKGPWPVSTAGQLTATKEEEGTDLDRDLKHVTGFSAIRLQWQNTEVRLGRLAPSLSLAMYSMEVPTTDYTECWTCPLFDILLDKYFPAG
jgi:hypothetical protein